MRNQELGKPILFPSAASPFFLSRPDPILQPIISRYLELNCTAVGQSPLDVTWTKNGNSLSQQGRVSVELNTVGATVTTVVRIASVEEGDAGEYVCRAKDEDGTSSSSTTVNVRGVHEVLGCEVAYQPHTQQVAWVRGWLLRSCMFATARTWLPLSATCKHPCPHLPSPSACQHHLTPCDYPG